MSKIAGRAKRYDGTAIDYVSIFDWSSGACIKQVITDASGNWEFYYDSDIVVGLTYVADGCEPITHGSYRLSDNQIKHKWWRFKNIAVRADSMPNAEFPFASISVIKFYNINSDVISVGGNAISSSVLADYHPYKAFDNLPKTFFVPKTPDKTEWIGYEFTTPVFPMSVGLQQRSDSYIDNYGQEWQECDLEYSDDGINWFFYKRLKPMIPRALNPTLTMVNIY